ncbi:hypothetical protein S245_017419, partial [Arachis hypogaea]
MGSRFKKLVASENILINAAEFVCPFWFFAGAKTLIQKIMDLNHKTCRVEDAASNDGPKSNKEDCGDPNDPCVRLKHDCVGILAGFRVKDPSRHVVIGANTHLYWILNGLMSSLHKLNIFFLDYHNSKLWYQINMNARLKSLWLVTLILHQEI